jgi:hypothetical protein
MNGELNMLYSFLDRMFADLALRSDNSKNHITYCKGKRYEYDTVEYPYRDAAYGWFFSDEENDPNDSRWYFLDVCRELDLPPSCLRKYAEKIYRTGKYTTFMPKYLYTFNRCRNGEFHWESVSIKTESCEYFLHQSEKVEIKNEGQDDEILQGLYCLPNNNI